METVYERIKRLRKENNMTQTELAQKIGYADKTAISKIEAGHFEITQSKAKKFASALGVSVSYLLDGYDSQDAFETFVEMNEADKIDYLNRLSIYMETFLKPNNKKEYPITMDVTEGERKLILELRENKGTSVDDLTEKFNAILKHRANNNPIDIEEPAIYEIRVEQYLGKKRK